MTDLRHATRLTILVASAALIVAACGGSTAATPVAGEATPTPVVAEATPTPAAATPEPATPEAAATTEAPSFNLTGLTQNLADVDSYRIAIAINGTPAYQATVVLKPDKAAAITLGDGTDATRIIKIGAKAWLATGSDAYQEVPASMVDPLVGSFDPIVLLGAFASGNIGAIANDLGSEQKNGINTHHYRIDSTSSLVGAFAALPAGAAIDFWVADEGYLVGYSLTGVSNEALSIDISNVNDSANVITAPS